MTQAVSRITVSMRMQHFLEFFLTWGVYVGAGALYFTIGWIAAQPDDPLGAVSLLARHHALGAWIQIALLSAATAALATLLAGRHIPDVGIIAVGIGLAALAARGENNSYLLVRAAEQAGGPTNAIGFKLAAEAIAWFVIALIAIVSSGLAARWMRIVPHHVLHGESGELYSVSMPICADELPLRTAPAEAADRPASQTLPLAGLTHAALAAGISLVCMGIIGSQLASRAIRHGQVLFLVGASVAVGVYVAWRLAPTRSAIWSVLSVLVLALVAYAWGAVRPVDPARPPAVPVSQFLRPLPIQYIAAGMVAAVMSFAYALERSVEHSLRTESEPKGKEQAPKRK